MKKTAAATIITALISISGFSAVIFEQDFSSSTDVADYVNASATPSNTTQFGALSVATDAGPFAISSEALALDRTEVGYASNKIARGNLAGGSLMLMEFDLKIESANYTQNGTGLSIGAGTSVDNPLGAYNDKFVFLTFTGVDGNGVTMTANGGSTSAKYTIGSQDRWAFYMNNTASAEAYLAPNGSAATVAARSYDLWIGNTAYFDDEARYYQFSDAKNLQAFSMGMSKNDDSLWTFDNMKIQDAIPEPASLGLLLGALGLVAWRKRNV